MKYKRTVEGQLKSHSQLAFPNRFLFIFFSSIFFSQLPLCVLAPLREISCTLRLPCVKGPFRRSSCRWARARSAIASHPTFRPFPSR